MPSHSLARRIFTAAACSALAGGFLLVAAPVAAGDPVPQVATRTSAPAAAAGTVSADSAPSSAVSTGAVDFQVYLPAGYDPADSDTRYPTLYLLHGRGDSDSAWTREKADLDRLIADGSVPPVIVVMPDAPWESGGSWYVDSAYTGDGPAEKVETAITDDLVTFVDEKYRTVAARTARAVGGYSMGGFGALRYVLAHQDEFSAAIVLSPAVFTPQPPDPDDVRDYGAFGVGSSLFDADRYTALNYPGLLSHVDPTKPLRIYLAVGDKEYQYPHPYEHNDLDFETMVAYNQLIRTDGITADLRVLGGGHDWDVWQPAFVEALQLIGPGISPSAPQPMQAPLFGGTDDDWAGGVVPADDGGVTVTYGTSGDVGTAANAGGLDVAVEHLAADGSTTWTTPIANSATQRTFGAAAGPNGTVYVGGYTGGDLDGQHGSNTKDDAFVSAVGADGTLLWTTQFGDPAQADRVYAVGADPAGGAYVAGYTKGSLVDGVANAGDKDVFVARLDATGAVTWIRQFGSSGEDKGFAVAAFDGGVAVAGLAGDAMPGADSAGSGDGFVATFAADGTSRWLRQLGSNEPDLFSGLTVGADGTLVAVGQYGGSVGGESSGGLDALAVGYTTAGDQGWISRWGTAGDDQAATVTVDPAGGYLVSGATDGAFTKSLGGFDVFVSRLAANGTIVASTAASSRVAAVAAARTNADAGAPNSGTVQFGTSHDDGVSQYAELNMYAAASSDRLWITGATFGSTADARNAGGADVFLTSLALTPTGPSGSTTTPASATTTSSAPSASSTTGSESGAGSSSGSTSADTTAATAGSTASDATETTALSGSTGTSALAGASQSAGVAPPPSGGSLSYTGIAALSLLAIAGLLLAAGAIATTLGRRSPNGHAA